MDDRDRLIVSRLDLVEKAVRRMAKGEFAALKDDFTSAAHEALVKAADTWDESRGPFGAWAWLVIQSGLVNEIERLSRHLSYSEIPPSAHSLEPSPQEEVELNQLRAALETALADMYYRDPLRASLVMARFPRDGGDPVTYDMLGRALGVNRQRAFQLVQEGLEQLRLPELRAFLEDI